MTQSKCELELTGERTLPGIPRENYWFKRHVATYSKAIEFAREKKVVDLGCGEGYGPFMLAQHASKVVAVDISEQVINHAKNKYKTNNLSFEIMDVCSLNLEDSSFDVAISFQVAEHLENDKPHFEEMSRILNENGIAIITTPNRLTISCGNEKPINPFHLREYTPEELRKVLEKYFSHVEIKGLFHRGWLSLNDKLKIVDFIKVYEMSRFNPRFWTHRLFVNFVRATDFQFKRDNLENCLDILAICRK
ncbi:MAG: class I SAM-dependent methyltransferase [Actinomycetota bacterium]|nr:class I SAM-dependent methyltransferase [Actinomycetota bacterium]